MLCNRARGYGMTDPKDPVGLSFVKNAALNFFNTLITEQAAKANREPRRSPVEIR